MFSTLSAVIATVVFLLPGFVVADLAQRQRAGSPSLGDQRALLRALFFSVAIHLAAAAWTWELAQELQGEGWHDELGELVAYVLVVVVLVPVALGLLLSESLLRAERGDGRLNWWHYALGARDARDAWDFAFQRYRDKGVWVLSVDNVLVNCVDQKRDFPLMAAQSQQGIAIEPRESPSPTPPKAPGTQPGVPLNPLTGRPYGAPSGAREPRP